MIEDKPISEALDDKLGFRITSHYLATAFLQNDLSRGFVVGVEGIWGSGKSSLVNLALEELSKNKNDIAVIKFAPWLVGGRDELLSQLFSDLEPVILRSLPEQERSNTRDLIERYAEVSSGLAALAEVAEMGGMPWAGNLKKILRSSGSKAKKMTERSLNELNKSLRKKLEMLHHPIVVFVDDLDRLEPRETVEVLRLIKSVADFPNVAYVLAYDSEVVSSSLEKALGISNGEKYLEKIVQASFKVPDASGYDLINWMRDEVSKLVSEISLGEEERKRLHSVYYNWCTWFIKTPRDVTRVLNSLRLNYIPVKEYVDAGDMLFLQTAKTKSPKLFNWIEAYASSMAAASDGYFISSVEQERSAKLLQDIIRSLGYDEELILGGIVNHLPGIESDSRAGSSLGFRVHSGYGRSSRKYFNDRRLGSLYHFSYYFSFSKPSGSIDDQEVSGFISLCDSNQDEAIKKFKGLASVERPQGGRLAEVLMQRLSEDRSKILPSQVKGIFSVLMHSMDDLIPVARTELGYSQFLRGNRDQIFGLLDQVKNFDHRESIVRDIFKSGKSLDWSTGIIRESLFDYETSSDANKSRQNGVLTKEEFLIAKKEYLLRLGQASSSDLMGVNYFLPLMYTWYYLGDMNASLNFVQQQTKTDVGFINILERMSSWSESSSEGVQYILMRDTVKMFFGSELEVKERLAKISSGDHHAYEVQGKADYLFNSMESESNR